MRAVVQTGSRGFLAPGPWLAQSVPKPAGVHFGVCRVFLRDSVGICGGRATNRCEVASSSARAEAGLVGRRLGVGLVTCHSPCHRWRVATLDNATRQCMKHSQSSPPDHGGPGL